MISSIEPNELMEYYFLETNNLELLEALKMLTKYDNYPFGDDIRELFNNEILYFNNQFNNIPVFDVAYDVYFAKKEAETYSASKDDLGEDNFYNIVYDEEKLGALKQRAKRYFAQNNIDGRKTNLNLGTKYLNFYYFVKYRIDEISSFLIDIIYSHDRLREEKILLLKKFGFIKEIYKLIIADFTCTWHELSEHPNYKFMLGFFHGQFVFLDAIIWADNESTLSYYQELLTVFYLCEKHDINNVLCDFADKLISRCEYKTNKFNAEIQKQEKDIQLYIPDNISRFAKPVSIYERDECFDILENKGSRNLLNLYLDLTDEICFADLLYNKMIIQDNANSDTPLLTLADKVLASRNEILTLLNESISSKDIAAYNRNFTNIKRCETELKSRMNLLDIIENMIELVSDQTSIIPLLEKCKENLSLIWSEEKSNIDTYLATRIMAIQNKFAEKIEIICLEDDYILSKHEKISLLPYSSLTSLKAGEILYDKLIKNLDKNEDFDYSCIAILYFKALECLLNHYLYRQYCIVNGVLDINRGILIENIDKRKIELFGKEVKGINNSRRFNENCELGKYQYIYDSKNIKNIPSLRKHIANYLGISNYDILVTYCKEVGEISGNRNKAAHGSFCLGYDDAIKARNKTYIEEISNTKGLILKFLDMIHLKE